MSFSLEAWALRHGVGWAALAELRTAFGHDTDLAAELDLGDSENVVQAHVRLAAAANGFKLYRNNVGALKDKRGVPVRYGLCNDTEKLNKVVKSSDLIGWKPEVWLHPETFEPTKIARFVSIECKKADWPGYNPDDAHEKAQQRWLELVQAAGGLACFSKGELPI